MARRLRGWFLGLAAERLALLAEDAFADVHDALAVVGLGLAVLADLRGELADGLLVTAPEILMLWPLTSQFTPEGTSTTRVSA